MLLASSFLAEKAHRLELQPGNVRKVKEYMLARQLGDGGKAGETVSAYWMPLFHWPRTFLWQSDWPLY